METVCDSALDRMGITDSDCLPINPVVRWNKGPVEDSICIESGLYPNEYDFEKPFDPDCFGMYIDDMASVEFSDGEWKRFLDTLDF